MKLDGKTVTEIYSDLRAPTLARDLDLTSAKTLTENTSVAFQGIVPRSSLNKKDAAKFKLPNASFVLDGKEARALLQQPSNPNGRPNRDVVVPYLIGDDITGRPMDRFIVDFGEMREQDAALYESPYAYIEPVKQHRAKMTQPQALQTWWIHWRSRPEMRAALKPLSRYIATPRVSKHRLFVWRQPSQLADNAIVAIARDDDVTFGILHSKYHAAWALKKGTALEDRPRYTPTTTFETFPFPEGLTPSVPASAYLKNAYAVDIASAAKRLDELRNAWLNPPEWVDFTPEVVTGFPDRLRAKNAEVEVQLRKRTLTNLYNLQPQWLVVAHRVLDEAVAAAYGWSTDISEDESLARLLALNLDRTGDATLKFDEADDDLPSPSIIPR
jgi:hypothetical protein